MKTFRVLVTACALVCFGAAIALAQPIGRPDTPTLLKKVDSFAFVVDTSGSMMMTSTALEERKIDLAKRLAGLINDRIPELDYAAGLYTVTPAATSIQPAAWNRLALGTAVAKLPRNLPIYARLTALGDDVAALQSSAGGLRNGAVILLSDGYKNLGEDAIAAFRSLLQASGAKLYIISFADTKIGKATLEQLAALSSTSVYDGGELLYNPVALDSFVETVFYKATTPVIIDSVYFDTAKWNLKPEAVAILDNAIVTINNIPRGVRTVEVEDYADAQGGVGLANKVLSERRASSVKEYLVSKGVPTAKIYERGNNVSFKFNNATVPGRHDNRRADLIIN
jgi:outer membrane protein OmpA-like peptidoglycan-associated protein